MRSRRRRLPVILSATVLAVTAVAGTVSATADSVAEGAADDFVYDVYADASHTVEIPGVATDLSLDDGQSVYLWTRDLAAENVTALSSGENIGTTFGLKCRNADGTDLDATEQGTYWAANLVPPGETQLKPTLRWLFTPPAAGDYHCFGTVTGYSSVVAGGKDVQMRIPAGASLAQHAYPAARSWMLPQESERVVSAGQEVTTLGVDYRLGTDEPKIAVVQDANLTTCKPGSHPCGEGSGGVNGATVRTVITVKQLNADDTECAAPISGEPATRRITDAKHHLAATNTLYLERSQLADCDHLRLSLVVTVTDGNPVVLHGGLSSGMSRSHGVVFEYA